MLRKPYGLYRIRRHWSVRYIVWATTAAVLTVQVSPADLLAALQAGRTRAAIHTNSGASEAIASSRVHGLLGKMTRSTHRVDMIPSASGRMTPADR